MSDCKSCCENMAKHQCQVKLLSELLSESQKQTRILEQEQAQNKRLMQALMGIKTDVGRFVDESLEDDKD